MGLPAQLTPAYSTFCSSWEEPMVFVSFLVLQDADLGRLIFMVRKNLKRPVLAFAIE